MGIKSPSINVENILTKISKNSKQESHAVVQPLLSEILQSLPIENHIVSEKVSPLSLSDTGQHPELGKTSPEPKFVQSEQNHVKIVTVKPVSTSNKRPSNDDVGTCPKRQRTPQREASVTSKKSWIDFITFEQPIPEPIIQRASPDAEEKEAEFDVEITQEDPIVDAEEEEEPLEIEQQLNFPQEKDLDIEIEINEECQKQEL